MRRVIKDTAPIAEACVSYGIAGYKYLGMLVYFTGFKNHCSLFPASGNCIKHFSEELKNDELYKGTIRFALNKPIPATLLKKW